MRRRELTTWTFGRPRPLGIAVFGLAALLAVAGCAPQSLTAAGTPGSGSSTTSSPGAATGASSASSSPADVTISGSLSSGRLLTDAALHASVTAGTLTGITVTGPDGKPVPGALSAAAGTWTPAHPLTYATTYTVSATATNTAGESTSAHQTYTTITPSTTVRVAATTPSSGHHVGDAQPMVVIFTAPVTDKAQVEKQLKLTDTSHVTGAWRWLSDTRVDYRPKTYWPMGDTVTLTADLTGVQAGPHLWGAGTFTSTFTVTSDLHAVVDAAKHTVTVSIGGKVVRTLATDTGMPQFATWGGSMVVLQKMPKVQMTSCSVGLSCTPGTPNYYDLAVYMDVQLTPSGTFVHAAPWDTQLGLANTSHGCIHLSNADAAWFYSQVQEGDLVTVKNAGQQVKITNGEGDWNLSWAQWTA